MKHLMKCLCAALVLALLASSALAEIKLDTAFRFMTSIKPVAGTSYLLVESKQDKTLGLFTTDGQQRIPYGNTTIESLKYDFFSAYSDKEAVDGKTLWKGDGRKIGETGYAGFKVFNNHWVLAFVVDPENTADQDYKVGSTSYAYARIDLYYITDENIEPIASLDRDAYSDAFIHGDKIAIINRSNEITLYDSSFEPVDIALTSIKNPLYKIDTYQLISLLDNANLGDGYSEVSEVNLSDRMLVKATRLSLDGTKLAALMEADGTVILPADYEVLDVTDHYALVADAEKQQGLFSLDEGRFLVPCQYTSILSSATDIDKYVHNGYVCVEMDEKLGFYDVANDVESCAPKYFKRAVKVIGCALYYTTVEGDLMVVAGDGAANKVEADELLTTNGDGYLLEAKLGTSFGLVDWHGNIVLPLNHYKEITLTNDSLAMIRTSTGLQLDKITR
ncbi:MAG: WG repeat-containing protein [Clostridia bacterium]|nr:WG repeat-containing protein [Clostridia bacterium]MBR0407889.1 WG repeat-containing protein [Clostridia bacterium]